MDKHLISYAIGLLVIGIFSLIYLILRKKPNNQPLTNQIQSSFEEEMDMLKNKIFSIETDLSNYENLKKMDSSNQELAMDNVNMRHNINFMKLKKDLFVKNPKLMENYRVTTKNSLFDYLMSNTRNK